MPLYTRETLPKLLAQSPAAFSPVVLLFGERYLCQTAAQQLEATLLRQGGHAHTIDGDREDYSATLHRLRSFNLLGGRQIYRVNDTRLFLSKQFSKPLWNKALQAHVDGKFELARRNLRNLLSSADLSLTETDLAELSGTEWQQCFGFPRPEGNLEWTRSSLQDADAPDNSNEAADKLQTPRSTAAQDPAELLIQALNAGLPQQNTLLLLAEEVDKRKKLFKLLKDNYTVIDLSVEAGASTKARKAQGAVLQDLLRATLAEQDKTLAPGLTDVLLKRVGFHPVALVMELRKVMLFVGERRQITREDVDNLIGQTRQEALFELTAVIGNGNLREAQRIAEHLLANGIHALVIVATLRNFTRSLLLCRALQEQPELLFQPSMSAESFQQRCLPLLKERSQWQKELAGHPYALYMQFKTAQRYPLGKLAGWLQALLAAELRLKGSALDSALILHNLLLDILQPPC